MISVRKLMCVLKDNLNSGAHLSLTLNNSNLRNILIMCLFLSFSWPLSFLLFVAHFATLCAPWTLVNQLAQNALLFSFSS